MEKRWRKNTGGIRFNTFIDLIMFVFCIIVGWRSASAGVPWGRWWSGCTSSRPFLLNSSRESSHGEKAAGLLTLLAPHWALVYSLNFGAGVWSRWENLRRASHHPPGGGLTLKKGRVPGHEEMAARRGDQRGDEADEVVVHVAWVPQGRRGRRHHGRHLRNTTPTHHRQLLGPFVFRSGGMHCEKNHRC